LCSICKKARVKMTLISDERSGMALVSARPPADRWRKSIRRVLVAGDAVCALVAFQIVLGLRWWLGGEVPWFEVAVVGGLVAAWPAAMGCAGAYEEQVHGEGAEEFRSVINGGLGLAAAVGLGAYIGELMIARSTVLAMLPLATVLTLLFRQVAVPEVCPGAAAAARRRGRAPGGGARPGDALPPPVLSGVRGRGGLPAAGGR
jgi:hypothetical protein